MKYCWGECFLWALLSGIAAGLVFLVVTVQADAGSTVGVDPLLTYMQAAGFPAWAGVVAWGVLRITGEIKAISAKLDSHVMLTERRLSRLEVQTRLNEYPEDMGI